MTNAELIEKLRGIQNGIGSAHVLYVATGSTMDLMAERIWGEGGLTNGGKLTYKGDTPSGIYIYSPPWPKKGSGKGKPYDEWIVRPESVADNRKAIASSVRLAEKRLAEARVRLSRANTQKQMEAAQASIDYWEVRGEVASQKRDAFASRFGANARKIKGTWAPSYIAAKTLIGRGDTPFELSGTLRKDWLGGVTPTPREDTPYRCAIVVSEKSDKIIEGLTETKGAFIQMTADERAAHYRHVLEAYRELVLNVQ